MIGLRKYFRLLPAVVAVGFGLLAMKGVDLARAAQSPAAASDVPDNSGLAPADAGGAKPRTDFAADDGSGASSAEVDVLTSLTRRRAELDARERALNMRENVLVAGEGRVDQKIAALKTLQTQIQSLLSQRDAAQDKQIASLVKTYAAMKPKDAARIFDTLADEVLLPVAKGLKSDVLAPVMAAMNPEAAQRLTVKLAALLKLPETPAAADCPTPPAPTPASSTDIAPPVPGTTASIAPPLQTVALAPPPATSPAPATPSTQSATPAVPPPHAAAASPPKPHKLLAHKPAPVKTATAVATPTATPATSTVAPPAKSATDPAATIAKPSTASVAPVVKPEVAPAAPPAKSVSVPAVAPPSTQAAMTAPPKPVITPPAPVVTSPPASGPPVAITPTTAKGG
jgi:flagellar motility protein MotE (MotC chaperone)